MSRQRNRSSSCRSVCQQNDLVAIECAVAEIRRKLETRATWKRGEGMKRAAIVIAVLVMCAWSFGQGNDKPAAGQSAQSAPAGQATAAAPQGKRPPAAKTQPEYEAWKAALAMPDP